MTTKKLALMALALIVAIALAPRISSADTAPTVTVGDQVVMDHYVTIAKVMAAQDGWIVIHAGDKDGTVLGYEAVKSGENDNVEVEIDMSKGTPTVSAMLHIDAGTAGKYEFPGVDAPVKDASGAVVNVPFKIIGTDVDDQFVKDSKTVKLNDVIAQQDGWIVIHAGDKDGTVLGQSPIKAGLNTDVSVALTDVSKVTDMMTAMIHIDAGTIGKYEFPGADTPPQLGGKISNEPFWTVDHVRVEDQTLAADGTLTIPYVLVSQDGWLVIHAGDASGTVLGHTAIKKGLNEGIMVKIDDPSKLTDQVSAMPHIDAGTIGTYEFPGPDAPVKDTAGKVINVFFSTKGQAMMPAATGTMSMGDMNATMAATPAATKSG